MKDKHIPHWKNKKKKKFPQFSMVKKSYNLPSLAVNKINKETARKKILEFGI